MSESSRPSLWERARQQGWDERTPYWQRQKIVPQLREEGYSYQQIADVFRVTWQAIRSDMGAWPGRRKAKG